MPTRPLKSCSCPGCESCAGRCPELVPRGRCAGCGKQASKQWTNQERRKVYNSRRWKGLRRQVLSEQPWCAEDGCHQLATDVDHVTPLRAGGAPGDRANTQPLCHRHHSAKTAKEIRPMTPTDPNVRTPEDDGDDNVDVPDEGNEREPDTETRPDPGSRV